MLRLLSISLLLLICATVRAADVEPQIVLSTPTPNVYVGDQILIDVEATAVEDDIDFSPLWQNLELQRQTYGTRIAVIGGKVVEIRIWRFEAQASEPGVVVLGPVQSQEIASNTTSTSIEAAPDVRWIPGSQDIRFNVDYSKTNLYVQEQLLLTVTLVHRHPLSNLEISEPALDGLRVIPIINDRRTETDGVNGREYQFIRRYALFAQASGEVTIPAFVASGQIIKSRLERADFSLSSTPQTIQVIPAPAENKDRWWLPAKSLKAYDEWTKDKRWLAAGEQVQRSAVIEASGVSSEQLPDIVMPQARGLRVSFIDSERETLIDDNGVSARARFNFNIRAISPVPVFPDPIAVHWWNTNDDTATVAYIRTGRIDIGAPSRDALLDLVADQRSPLDALSQYRQVLILFTILIVALAIYFHCRATGTSLMEYQRRFRNWLRLRIADYNLRRASHRDNQSFVQAIYNWQHTTGFKFDPARNQLVENALKTTFSDQLTDTNGKESHVNTSTTAARALIRARRN